MKEKFRYDPVSAEECANYQFATGERRRQPLPHGKRSRVQPLVFGPEDCGANGALVIRRNFRNEYLADHHSILPRI